MIDKYVKVNGTISFLDDETGDKAIGKLGEKFQFLPTGAGIAIYSDGMFTGFTRGDCYIYSNDEVVKKEAAFALFKALTEINLGWGNVTVTHVNIEQDEEQDEVEYEFYEGAMLKGYTAHIFLPDNAKVSELQLFWKKLAKMTEAAREGEWEKLCE